jgi:hypothetical protein
VTLHFSDGSVVVEVATMPADRVDFISAYCDRWCERCAFTGRCSDYACKVAIAMCDDVEAGIELAVGRPQPVGREKEQSFGERLMENVEQWLPSESELAAFARQEEARRERLECDPLTGIAETYTAVADAWLKDYADRVRESGDTTVREALDIIQWDLFLIVVKLRRALDGHDRSRTDEEEFDDDPIQNDWNGSAKVALISLARSEQSWRTVASATRSGGAAVIIDLIGRLRTAAHDEFPDAMRFKRPGFDEAASAGDDGRMR